MQLRDDAAIPEKPSTAGPSQRHDGNGQRGSRSLRSARSWPRDAQAAWQLDQYRLEAQHAVKSHPACGEETTDVDGDTLAADGITTTRTDHPACGVQMH